MYLPKVAKADIWIYWAGFGFQSAIVGYFYLHLDAAILRLMPDDAFYYLKIAENISRGLGSVFSPNELTNGYHPLWMLILVATHWLLHPTPAQFILAILMIAVGLNVLAAWLLVQWLDTLGFSRLQCDLGAVGYLFLPWFVCLTLTGLETPLYYACLFAFFLTVQRLRQADSFKRQQSLSLGVTAGLVMLARTDAVLFTLLAFGLLLFRKKAALKLILSAGVGATTLLLPWLVWSWVNFGTIEQSSSVAIASLHHSYVPSLWSSAYWNFALQNFLSVLYWAVCAPLLTHTAYTIKLPGWPLWLTSGVALLTVLVGYRSLVMRDLKVPVLLWLPALVLLFFYCAIRLFVQVWHLAPLFILLLVVLINFSPRHPIKPWTLTAGMLLLCAITVYSLQNAYFRPQEWHQRVDYFQTYWPDGATQPLTVCITDSGIPAYFSKHTVVNLDGVVNNRVLQFIRAGRFSDYVVLKQCDRVIMDAQRLTFYDRNMPAGARPYTPTR
ncbi:MAG: hypothetical protein M3Q45_04120 [Chloroflexota bacterium]|nr:hypothetical protein [Chloroflexota bacterium]